MTLGWALPRRRHLLDELKSSAPGPTFPVSFQGQLQHLLDLLSSH